MAFARCKCGFVKKNVPDKHIGRKTKCPKCGESILIQKDKPQDEVETSKNETKIKAESGCPKCGYERYQGDTSCPRCGVVYDEYTKKHTCPNPGCNAFRSLEDAECPKCGTLYSSWDNKTSYKPSNKNQKKEKTSFFGGLFDLSFSQFITTEIVKILYIGSILFSGIMVLLMVIRGFSQSIGYGFVTLLLSPVIFFLQVIFVRMWFEFIVVIFKIAENTGNHD